MSDTKSAKTNKKKTSSKDSSSSSTSSSSSSEEETPRNKEDAPKNDAKEPGNRPPSNEVVATPSTVATSDPSTATKEEDNRGIAVPAPTASEQSSSANDESSTEKNTESKGKKSGKKLSTKKDSADSSKKTATDSGKKSSKKDSNKTSKLAKSLDSKHSEDLVEKTDGEASKQPSDLKSFLDLLKSVEEGKKIYDLFPENSISSSQSKDGEHAEEAGSDQPPAKEVVPLVISVLKKYKENAGVIKGALGTVRYMDDREGLRSVFRDNEGISILLELLKSKDEAIRKASLRFLGDLITKNSSPENVLNAGAFAEASGLPTIVTLLEDSSLDIQMMSAGVIRVMSGYEGLSTTCFQDEFRQANAVKPMLVLLQSTNMDMIRQVSNGIRNLVDGNQQNQNLFIENNVIGLLIDQLQKISEPKVQQRLLDALNAITLFNESSVTQMVDKGGVDLLVQLLTVENECREQALLIIRNLAHQSRHLQVRLQETGVLANVLLLLKSDKSPESLLRASCLALSALIERNAENLKLALDQKILDTLVPFLEQAASDRLKASILELMMLLVFQRGDLQDTLMNTLGGLQKIIPLLKSKAIDVQENALELLRVSRINDGVKAMLIEEATTLVDLLSHPSLNVKEAAITCLESLLPNEKVLAIFSKDKKFLHNLTDLFDISREKVIIRACTVVDLLCRNAKFQEMIAKSHIPEKFVALLKDRSAGLGLHTKENLAYSIWATSNNCQKGQSVYAKLEVIPILVDLMAIEQNAGTKEEGAKEEGTAEKPPAISNDILREYCAGSIYSLCFDNAVNQKLLYGCKGVEALVSLLSDEHENVQLYASKALWASCEAQVKNQEIAIEGKEALLKLLKSKNAALQAASASAIWSISSKNQKNQDAFRECGVIPWIVDIVIWHSKDYIADPKANSDKGRYLQAAVGAIAALTLKNVANRDAFNDSGALNAVEFLKDVEEKYLRREVSAALVNLGSKLRTRSDSVIENLWRKASSAGLPFMRKDESASSEKAAAAVEASNETAGTKEKTEKKGSDEKDATDGEKKKKKKKKHEDEQADTTEEGANKKKEAGEETAPGEDGEKKKKKKKKKETETGEETTPGEDGEKKKKKETETGEETPSENNPKEADAPNTSTGKAEEKTEESTQ